MELLEALETIKGECKKHNRCDDCPLRRATMEHHSCCEVRYVNPHCWNLKTSVEVPRLFK